MARAMLVEAEAVGAEEERESGDVAASDPQEFDFLPRREGRAWSPELVETRVRDVRTLLEESEAHDGEARHKVGTLLRELYAGFAERAKGRRSFREFAQAEFDLSQTNVYELLQFAAAVTQAQARQYGITRCLLGLRLLELTGVQSFDALSKKPLPTETADEIFFLPRTPKRQLQSAIRVLVERRQAAALTPTTRKAANEVQRLNRELARLVEDDQVLAKVPVRYVTGRDGEPMLKIPLLDREQRKAFVRLLPKLLRAES